MPENERIPCSKYQQNSVINNSIRFSLHDFILNFQNIYITHIIWIPDPHTRLVNKILYGQYFYKKVT